MSTNLNATRPEWASSRRIVVKIGSALLVDRATGKLRSEWLDSLAADAAALVDAGKQVVLVSSGAIALGRHVLGLPKGALELEKSQAAAAVGQISLSSAYQDAFRSRGITIAQILLTLGDTEERRRYLNARRTIDTLLEHRAIPVVNENDTVATSEIRYGDNDRLSARVASMMSADTLVLLSEIEAMAGDAASELSRGGMKTKVEAGKIALASGTNMIIASGKVMHPLRAIADGGLCTWFLAPSDPVSSRKRWIAGQLEPRGVLEIDAGAERALLSGKSLLPAGVIRVDGTFDRGDAVIIRGPDGRELGRGLVAYARADADQIIGKKSGAIAAILGHEGRSELVHRDDMALSRS
jgi:glutamate 5-kinase